MNKVKQPYVKQGYVKPSQETFIEKKVETDLKEDKSIQVYQLLQIQQQQKKQQKLLQRMKNNGDTTTKNNKKQDQNLNKELSLQIKNQSFLKENNHQKKQNNIKENLDTAKENNIQNSNKKQKNNNAKQNFKNQLQNNDIDQVLVKVTKEFKEDFQKKNLQKEKQNQNEKKQKKKKEKKINNYFNDHINLEEVEKGLQEKTLFKGEFMMNENFSFFARVKLEDNKIIFINTKQDQNRALDKSTVLVKIIEKSDKNKNNDQNQNTIEKQLIIKDQQKDQQTKINTLNKKQQIIKIENSNELLEENLENKVQQDLSEDWEEFESDGLSVSSVISEKEKKLVGRVVYIANNFYQKKEIIGKIEKIYKEEINPNKYVSSKFKKDKYFFVPMSKKLPWMLIKEIDQSLEKEIKNDYENQYFSASYIDWPVQSKNPWIKLNRMIGKTGNLDVECEALLREHEIFTPDFTQETFEYLKKFESNLNSEKEYVIPKSEREKRVNLTSELIVTIDPKTARDLDDALSVTQTGAEEFEIGVHIADVGHFVDENTVLDEEARLRTTTVYLTHKVIPMLPRLLCENLCSLNPNVERLAFSIFFKINTNGDLLPTPPRLHKSIIKTFCKLSYDQAQNIIDDDLSQLPSNVKENQQLLKNIKIMNIIAQNRRKQRKENGSLFMENFKKYFIFNDEKEPIDFFIEQRGMSNYLVEEFMLLANQLVGKYMVEFCQEMSLLRKHEFPKQEKLINFNDLCKLHGVDLHISDSNSFQQGFESIINNTKLDENQKEIIKFRMRKVLQPAQYIIVDDKVKDVWHHFALNFDVYTHFTSPIRRYPDILVHRILYKILQFKQEAKNYINKQSMIDIMDRCNKQRTNSRRVQEGCDRLFFCIYLKKNILIVPAIIFDVTQQSIILIIPDFNIEKKIMFKEYKSIVKESIVEKEGIISLEFKSQEVKSKLEFQKFKSTEVMLKSDDSFPINIKINFVFRTEDNIYYAT